MPPKVRFQKDEIVAAALNVARKERIDGRRRTLVPYGKANAVSG